MNEESGTTRRNHEKTWATHESPAGLFQISFPSDWTPSRQENILNIVPPWGTGAVTVSAFVRTGTDPVPVKDLLLRTFKVAKPRSDLVKASFNDWTGWEQDYQTEEDGAVVDWMALAAEKGNVFALLTAYDRRDQMDLHRETYRRILHTLSLYSPV